MTQGMITVKKGNKVLMKIIIGCNGMKVKTVAEEMRKNWPLSAKGAYDLAVRNGLDDTESLVVVTESEIHYEGSDDISPLYRTTFQQPKFNPRWECGIVECLEIIEL